MATWWYAKKGKRYGPIEQEELTRLIKSGKVGSKTMLWKEDMDSWLPLDKIEELQVSKPVIPPPLSSKVSNNPLTYPMASYWRRFFARIFDLWWGTLLVSLVLVVLLSRYSGSLVRGIKGSGTDLWFTIFFLPIVLVLDAAVYRALGNTPGKALLGLKVGMIDASPLNFSQYLSRNLFMWASGLAFGLPFFNLLTMWYQASRIGGGKQASYDENKDYRVRAMPVGLMRQIGFGAIFFVLLIIMAMLKGMK